MSAACDHRTIQRTLFRMQADPAFARAILDGDREALASTKLSDADAELLRQAKLPGVTADPGDKRRTQVLGNLTTEFQLTLAAATRESLPAFLPGFLASDEFHRAVAEDGRLPFAFAAYAARQPKTSAAFGAVVELETQMARLRREASDEPHAASATEIALSPRARVLQLPEGTLDDAARLRAALDAGANAPAIASSGDSQETLVLVADARTSTQKLPEIRVEALAPPADELALRLVSGPVSAEERSAFAQKHGAAPEDLEGFLDGFVEDGFFVRGA